MRIQSVKVVACGVAALLAGCAGGSGGGGQLDVGTAGRAEKLELLLDDRGNLAEVEYHLMPEAVPEAVRVLRTSVRRLALFCVGAGVALAAFAMAWTVALLLIPDPLGIALMGEVWTASREIVLIWGLSFAAVNVGVGAAIGLRALEAAARTLRAAAIGSAAQFVGAVAGAYVGGVVGAAWGYLAACLIWIAIWWWEFRAAVRDRTIQDRSDDGPISHARASEDELD